MRVFFSSSLNENADSKKHLLIAFATKFSFVLMFGTFELLSFSCAVVKATKSKNITTAKKLG